MRSRHRPGGLFALVTLVTLAACGADDGPAPTSGSESEAPAAPPPATVATPDTALLWTVGLAESASTVVGGGPVAVLTALRTETLDGLERVTFELSGAVGVPGYRVEYVDRPLHDCGSGEPTYPVGDAWLQVRLEPAAAHTEEGRPTLGARDVPVGAPLLQRMYRTCDFEAVVVYVLALASPNRFRVLTLSDPSRIVVDIQR